MEKTTCQENHEWTDEFGVVRTDTHEWKEKESVLATVQVLKCQVCGKASSAWERMEDILARIAVETTYCSCADKKHEAALKVYDTAVKHIIHRIRHGVKMAASCDGKTPN